MLVVRIAVLLLLVTCGVAFALYAATGQPKYRTFGLVVLKWTLVAAFGFFAVLVVENLVS